MRVLDAAVPPFHYIDDDRQVSEAKMSRSSRRNLDHTPLALAVIAGMLLGGTYACGGATSEAEPQVAPQESQNSGGTTGEIQRRPHEPIQSLLQGRTAGVLVTQDASGTIYVRLNTASSFYGGSEPLYVVDGTPIVAGPGGALRGINPEDIESIEVLKGPPETTIWGSRGANGVVLIKTKRPMKEGGGG